MRLWADACVTPELEGAAHDRGYEATCNRTRGLLTELDPNLYPVVVAEDWVFITNNEKDFKKLARDEGLHPGLVVLPQGLVAKQVERFGEVLDYIEDQSARSAEISGDWMVCRMVIYDEDTESVDWEWLPEEPAH